MKALARDKTQRFASAHEMMLALEAVVPRTERVDGELQEFMERLFADRLAERTAALEAALQAADAGLEIASGRPRPHLPVSQPTMRAVAVEYGPEIRVVSEAPAAEPGERDASPPPRRKAVQLALAAAAGAMLVAGAFRLRQETGARAPANANANANANASGEIETSVSPSQPLPSAASLSEPSLGMAPPADADGHADAGGAAASSSGASRAAPVKRHDRPLKREVPPDPSLLPAPPRSAEPAPVVDPLNRRR